MSSVNRVTALLPDISSQHKILSVVTLVSSFHLNSDNKRTRMFPIDMLGAVVR